MTLKTVFLTAVMLLGSRATASAQLSQSSPYEAAEDVATEDVFPEPATAPEAGPGGSGDTGDLELSETALERAVDPVTYILGPGDLLLLGLWGQQPAAHRLRVTLEGKLLVPSLGEIPVAGLSLAEGRDFLSEKLRGVFRNVDITLTLLTVRRIKVPVTGFVASPGIFEATALERVSAAIRRASGFREGGSRRRILVLSDGQPRATADLLRFSVFGEVGADPVLRSGDHIHVPIAREFVRVNGAVAEPGGFEFLPGDRLSDVLAFAGDLRPDAQADTLEITRFLADDAPPERFYVTPADTVDGKVRYRPVGHVPGTTHDDGPAEDFELRASDQVFVRTLGDWRDVKTVVIAGEVRYPGAYPIEVGRTRLLDVIERAGNVTDEASLAEGRLVRTAFAGLGDVEFERLKKLPRADMTDDEYEYFKMRSREVPGLMVIDFTEAVLDDPQQNIVLMDGDRVNIPRKGDFVSVLGMVESPGQLTYDRALDVGDYVRLAGGYTDRARKGHTRVVRAATGQWLEPGEVDELGPGDTIWVPEKPDRDWWALFRDSLAVLTQFATIYLLVDRVSG